MMHADAGSPDLRRAWYAVLLCMVAYIFSFVDRQILALLIEPIQADLGISDTQFGLLHGFAFAIFYAIMGIPVASLSDRMSRPLIISIGVAFWSLATVACGFARGFVQLFIARVCVGAGEAALSPATYSLISDLFPRDKLGRAVAVYSLGSFLGTGIAFLVGGWVIGAVSGGGVQTLFGVDLAPWQMAFLIVGTPGLFLALAMYLTIDEPRRAGAADEPKIPLGAVVRYLISQRAIFVPHMIGFTCAGACLYALLSWSPAYLMRSFGLSAAESGLRLGAIAILAAGGGVLASGWIMDALTRRGRADAPFLTGMIGAVGVLAPLAMLPVVTDVTGATLVLACAFFFGSFPMPPSTAVMQIAAPPTMRSRVSAIFLMFNSLIGLGGSTALIGMLNDRVFGDPAAVGASMAVVGGAAAALALAVLAFGMRPFARFVGPRAS